MGMLINHRPSYSLLLLTSSLVARIDFVGRRKLTVSQIWSKKSSNCGSLLEAAALAISLGPKRPGCLCIVSSEFWTDILPLPADIVAIATHQELQNALALEAEIESGLAAFDSQVACQRLTSENSSSVQFCTTQILDSQVAELADLAKGNNTRLHSLAHPIAFLPLQESTSVAQAKAALAVWKNSQTDVDQELEELSKRAGRVLVQRRDCVPQLLVPDTKKSAAKQVALSVSLIGLTIVSCFCWNAYSHGSLQALQQAVEQLDQQQQSLTNIAAEIKRAESKLVNLRKESQEVDEGLASIESQLRLASEIQLKQNDRWSRLIDALAGESQDCWIRHIESTAEVTVVHGVSLCNADAHSFAARLERALSNDGWLVSPASTSSLQGDLYRFSISLQQIIGSRSNDRSNEVVVRSAKDAVGSLESLSMAEVFP